MNTFSWYGGPDLAERLGWTLLHSWWQIAAVTALYAGAALLMQHNSAKARYALACAALAVMSVLPVFTFYLLQGEQVPAVTSWAVAVEPPPAAHAVPASSSFTSNEQSVSAPHAPLTSTGQAGDAVARDLPPRLANWRGRLTAVLPWLSAGWIAGVLVFSLRPLLGLVTVQRLRSRGVFAAPAELTKTAADLLRRLQMRPTIQVALSTIVEVPTMIGYLRPMILVPAAAISGLSTQQWELILAHELAHIRRHDYLVNALQTALETLLFYHPGVWWVSAQMRAERENCCDDLAVALCGNRAAYVGALLKLEENRAAAVLALAANGGPLLRRVRRLLTPAVATNKRPAMAWLAGLVPLGAVAILLVIGSSLATGRGFDRRAARDEIPETLPAAANGKVSTPAVPPASTRVDRRHVERTAAVEVAAVAAHGEADDEPAPPAERTVAAEADPNEVVLDASLEDDARAPLKIVLLDQYSRAKKTWEEKSSGRVNLDLPELPADNYRLEVSTPGYATLNLVLTVNKDGAKVNPDQVTLYRRRYAILRYAVNTTGGRELTGRDVKQGRVAITYGSVPDLHGDWMVRQNADSPILTLHRMQKGNGFALPPEDVSYDEIDIAPEVDQYRPHAVVAERGLILLNRIIGNGPDVPHYAKILVEDVTETRPKDIPVIDSLLPPTRFPLQSAAKKLTAPSKKTAGEIALAVALEDAAQAPVKIELHNSDGRRVKTWSAETPGKVTVKLPELAHDTYTLTVSSAGYGPHRLPVRISDEGINPIAATVELFRARYVVLRYAINTAGERNLTGVNVKSGRIALSAGKLLDLDDWSVQQSDGAVGAHVGRALQNTGFVAAEEGTTFEQMEVAPPNDNYSPADLKFEKGMLLYNRVVGYRPEHARYAKLLVEDITEAKPDIPWIVEPGKQ